MKKYRIREFSPAWWITRVAGAICIMAGAYSWILLAYIFAG